jgi:hypothetical protein
MNLDPRFHSILIHQHGRLVEFPARPEPSTQPNWNQAVDRLEMEASSIHRDLATFLAEAHLTEDLAELRRIASFVQQIERDAAAIHYAVTDRADRLSRKVGA